MIPETELEYKKDELEVMEKDLKEIEGQIEFEKELGNDEEVQELESRRKTIKAYMRDLDASISSLAITVTEESGEVSLGKPGEPSEAPEREAERSTEDGRHNQVQSSDGTKQQPSDENTKKEKAHQGD